MTALDTGHDPDQTDLAAPVDPTGLDAGSATRRSPVRPDLGSVDAATRAYQRRQRRERRMTGERLTGSGRPVRAALARLPFVLVNIGMLAAAIVGVLWLTTMKDEAGLRATASRAAQSALQIQIESGNRDIQSLAALPRIDAAARSLGMVPAGDAPILQVSGTATTVIGTPAPATAQAPAAPTAPAPTTAAPTTPAATAPATSAPTTAAPTSSAPAASAPATSAPATKTPATKAPATKAPAASAVATTASGAVAPSSPAGPTSGAKTTPGAAVVKTVVKTSATPAAGTAHTSSAGSSASTAPKAAASADTTPTSKKAGR